jgi:hypothetical protein
MMFQQENSAKARIKPPAQRRKCTGRVRSGTRRYESAKAKCAMEFLRLQAGGEQKGEAEGK